MSTTDLIKSINAVADSSSELKGDERASLLAACEKLRSELESPREATIRVLFAPHQAIALKLAVDIKLFDVASQLSANGAAFTIEDLTSRLNADELLVVRVMRFLVQLRIFQEIGVGKFKSTPRASAYVTASPIAQAIIHFSAHNEVIAALPSYFAEKGYQSPGDAYDGPFQYARNTKLHSFDWLATRPELQHAFNVIMTLARSNVGERWFHIFPVSSKLHVNSPSDILLVDIGGGVGHDLIAFKKEYPDLVGTLILEEIPVVVDSIAELPSGIQATKHDFFDSQPVKGAKAYYLANVLHDWPDKQASKILSNIREAMSVDSILLINENVLPDWNVSPLSASVDFNMMTGFSSLERTKKQFESLLDQAGLELVKVWEPKDAAQGEGRRVLEAVLKRA